MYAVSATRTMANAKPKILEAPKPVSIDEIRARKRREAAEQRRQEEIERIGRQEFEAKEQRKREAVQKIEDAIEFWRVHGEGERRPARTILKEVCERRGFGVLDILGPSRRDAVCRVRDEAIRAVANGRPDLSLPAIGRIFKRDHTSILHSLRKTRTEGMAR